MGTIFRCWEVVLDSWSGAGESSDSNGSTRVRHCQSEYIDSDAAVPESNSTEPQQQFEFGWRLHVGCWPGDCCQTCDKAYIGMPMDGCVARWAVAYFGQKPAGSPLNCLDMMRGLRVLFWPPVPSSAYAAFLRAEDQTAFSSLTQFVPMQRSALRFAAERRA